MSSQPISEEELNAYVDEQLNASDRARVLEALGRDTALQQRVAEIQQTRSLLRHAYERPPAPPAVVITAPFWNSHKLAASLLLAVGVAIGAALHMLLPNSTITRSAGTHSAGVLKGVVIQVSEADPAKWEMALINARNVHKAYGDKPIGVEIVAYGPGLKMLHSDSVVASGLAEAQKNGVKLLACGNTMAMTHTTHDELTQGVGIVPAGVVEIIQRQQDGYAYVRP